MYRSNNFVKLVRHEVVLLRERKQKASLKSFRSAISLVSSLNRPTHVLFDGGEGDSAIKVLVGCPLNESLADIYCTRRK